MRGRFKISEGSKVKVGIEATKKHTSDRVQVDIKDAINTQKEKRTREEDEQPKKKKNIAKCYSLCTYITISRSREHY